MKKIILPLAVIFLFSCAQNQQKNQTVVKLEKNKKVYQKPLNIKTGWEDPNTYTVKVQSKDIQTARKAAKHRILKDIVNVRMMNRSRYMDIEKISAEFEKALKNGRIIQSRALENGIEIYFQIKEKNLKKKFEKK